MRVCIINWRDVRHPWSGGTEVHLWEFARQLSARGHAVTLLCGGYKGLPREETIDGIRILRVGGTYSVYFLAPFAYFFRCRAHTDLVMEDSHGLPFFARFYAFRPLISIVHHIHSKLFLTELPRGVGRILSLVERYVVPLFYRHIPTLAISESCAATLRQWGYTAVRTIVPGVAQAYFQHANPPTEPVILALGRLRKYKRVDLLIGMMPAIRRKVPGARLIIAGDGPERPYLERMITDLHLGEMVEIRGFVAEEGKRSLYRTARVFAFPSEMEGWGMVATEAAASGLPTVGFRVPGLTESVKDGVSGILAATSAEFQSALTDVLTDDALHARLSHGAREWAARHTWEEAGRQLDAWIRSMTSDENRYFTSIHRDARRGMRPVLRWRLQTIRALSPQSLLDVGCGTGVVVERLRAEGIDAQGIDPQTIAFDRCPAFIRPFLSQGSITAIPFADNTFDVVTCIDVLEHVGEEDVVRAIRECLRVSKRLVYLDITVLEDRLFIHRDPTHITKWSRAHWRQAIHEACEGMATVENGPRLPLIHCGVFVLHKQPARVLAVDNV